MTETLHIVHLKHRTDRLERLYNELSKQQIVDYKIWNGIPDKDYPPFNGIAKAHKQVVNYAKTKGLPSVIIAQDDIKFTANGAFKYFLKNIPSTYDIYLGSIYYGNIKKDNTVDDFAGLTLFMIHKRFYNTFLTLPQDNHLDRTLNSKGKYVVSSPFVAVQYNGYSDSRKAYCNYDIFLKGRKLFGQSTEVK